MTDGPTDDDIGPTQEMIHNWTGELLAALEDATHTRGAQPTEREIAMIQDLVSNRHTGTNQGDPPISPFEQEKLSARITDLERRVALILTNFGPYSEPRRQIRHDIKEALASAREAIDTPNPDTTRDHVKRIRTRLRRALANPLLDDRHQED